MTHLSVCCGADTLRDEPSIPLVIQEYLGGILVTHCAFCCKRGYRQVVRHELPKLAFAGSSPVTRSRNVTTWNYFQVVFILQ